MLKTEGLRFKYDGGETELAFPDLRMQKGEELLLLGASGTGKTTMLHLVAGMRTPSRGMVELAGSALSTLPTAERLGSRSDATSICAVLTVGKCAPDGELYSCTTLLGSC